MISQTLITIAASGLAGILYRAGGMGKEDTAQPRWIPKWMRHTKTRDIGLPLIMVLYLTFFNGWHWSLIPSFLLMFGAQTTYFKKDDTDARWFNWIFVGLAFSLCMLPYAYLTWNWIALAIRIFVVTNFVVLWSSFVGKDWLEEGGRGVIQILTLSLFLF